MLKKKIQDIQTYIEDKTGINLKNAPINNFEEVIKKRLKCLPEIALKDYLNYLQNSINEFNKLIELIVISETWFFREPHVFEYLVKYVKKKLKNSISNTSPLYFLSLPCSTGEEPYSIAIALEQAGIPSHLYRIEATDISEEAIEKAKVANYGAYSFREKKALTENYFTVEQNGSFTLKPHIKNKVNFKFGNAIEFESMYESGKYDVIFCRNLLIYFNTNAQKQLLRNIANNLKPDGCLIVATAEKSLAMSAGFICHETPYNFILYKSIEKTSLEKKIELPIVNTPIHSMNDLPLVTKNYEISKPVTQTIIIKAREMANQGKFDVAEKLCHDFLATRHDIAEPYYLLGVLEGVKGNDMSSEQYLSKAVYLDPFHYESLIHLALIAEKECKFEQAKLFKLRAKKALEAQSKHKKI